MLKLFRSTGIIFALAFAVPASASLQPRAWFDWFEYRGGDPVDAVRKPGAGEYRNPVIQGFYPDPSVTRVGDDFYLVMSTFSWFPGIPIFHSRDLVSWTQIGNAIDRPTQLDFKKLGLSRGVFAPTITHKDGTYYILNTCVECGGNFIITAKNPTGPWSDPVWFEGMGQWGIDPSLFFDDDGRAWVLNNDDPVGGSTYDGHRAIWIQEMDLKTLKLFGPRTMILNGGIDLSQKPIWIEGPHIFRKDGWYYLSAAEGGTAEGHSQVILRSKNVTGPFVPGPTNPILTQRDLPGDRAFPVTSAGHAQLVTTPDGKWWATFLAVRPYHGDYYNTGRETFLLPVSWEGEWPRILQPATEIPYVHARPDLPRSAAPKLPTTGAFTVREEFDGPKLPFYWMMMRQPRSVWYRLDGGKLMLTPHHEGLGDNGNPAFLARRQQHMEASAETVVRFDPWGDGDRAGLAALQNDDYWLTIAVEKRGGNRVIGVRRRNGPKDPADGVPLRSVPLTGAKEAPVYLKMEVKSSHYVLYYALKPGAWQPLGTANATMLSTKTAGGFVGAMMGPFAQRGK